MSLRCIILKISISICFISPICFAQGINFDTIQFYRHLKQNHLFNEQLIFNKELQKRETKNILVIDSLKVDIAEIYFRLNLADSCKASLLSVFENPNLSKAQQQKYIALLIINKEYKFVQKFISLTKTFNPGKQLYQKNADLSIAILKRELNKNDSLYNSLSVSPTLYELKARYLNPPQYSPAKAGVYSALVPGLGKLYIGNKNQAITAFIANILLAAQATESYLKSGLSTPRFIITASLFSIFYTGNIVGSITMAKKKKRDYFKQIDYEIFNYYSAYLNKPFN